MKKDKCLIITEVFYPESFLVNDLCFEMAQRGMEVEVLTKTPSYPYGKPFSGYKNKLYQKEVINGATVHRIPIISGYANSLVLKMLNYFCFLFCTSFAILFLGRKYAKVFVYQTGPLTVAIPGAIWKIIFGRKLIIYTQDIWPDSVFAYGFKKRKMLEAFLKAFTRWIYKYADQILISCKGFESILKNYAPQKEIIYCPNWSIISDDLFASKSDFEPAMKGKVSFTFAGNIGKVQNLENVLLGFEMFNRAERGCALHIVGDGSNLSIIKEIAESQNINDVVFWGKHPIERMPSFYEASDFLIISLTDKPIFALTVPSKFQTYLKVGKPVLGIIKGETAKLINENNIGVCADPSALQEIAQAFEKLYKSTTEEKLNYSKNALRLASRDFDREVVIDRIVGCLD